MTVTVRKAGGQGARPAKRPVRRVEVAVQGVRSPPWSLRLRRFCARVLEEAGAVDWDLSLLLCDDGRMQELNRHYRRKDRPTDVLSFPREDSRGQARTVRGVRVNGDIAVSLETLQRNARDYLVTLDEELKRLVVHGILHCAGMDHGSGKGKGMLALQDRLLRVLREERIIQE